MHRVSPVILALGMSMLLAACKPKPEIQTYTVPKEQSAPRPTMPGAVPGMASADGAVTPPFAGASASGTPGMNATPALAAQVSGFQTPHWQAPADWKAKPLGSVRKGSWEITGSNGETADLSVTVFPGDVGGDLANVNRWRQQLGLTPVNAQQLDSLLQHVDFAGGHGHVVSLASPNGQAILGAILPLNGATWFFKMQGPKPLIDNQETAFLAFLKTIDFSAPANP
ncbi:hypothetical protein [Cerasicoccus arenae]|uniref:Uncharacterized protein n=1 Tax=Cerasicoccus arenae TaxID=424488 RepID=A0A8J3D8V9_9BACT|nr:hypothetical protein [Cerasicoccus arenae]MBK1856892.1 hypothetical protein [Cerasicoccus arenae]GHB89695.1 hypothetical protein GCM10007047_00170 [Cerasicoccus arenae]